MYSNPPNKFDNQSVMIRDGIKRCATMIGVYLLCVGTILCILVYNFKTFEDDFSDEVQGSWTAQQYFKNKQLNLYTEEDGFTVLINGDTVEVHYYNEENPVSGVFQWKNGYSGTLLLDNGFESFVSIDMNTRGDLKLSIVKSDKTILLRKTEGTS